MKGLFKSKPKTPVDLVRQTRDLLIFVDLNPETRESKREEKFAELGKLLRELKQILYGNSEAEPVSEACARLTQEFFRENTLCLLIICLPKLNLEARKDATQVVANLQRQQVQSRLIACDYLEANIDLMDILVSGYEDTDMALHYGAMLRECIRHQSVARYVLESEHIKKFFNFIQLPNFDIAADAAATFKELMTRHKSTVAEFLSKNYDWFFAEYNSKLLESPNYITRRQAIKLLGDMLLDRSNSAVMTRYVSSRDNLRILMNLLRVLFCPYIHTSTLAYRIIICYLQPIRESQQTSLAYLSLIGASFSASLLILSQIKRMNNLRQIKLKWLEKLLDLNPKTDQT
ncbi:putative MO25-like protein At5g47540 isoform X3 [Cynara cardunculus var. scolymus]|uniref:putative MO25-like protein At5g47540 isoform X3 n=1 Tax=Cynara cardunculus var. scolymus TaxID=59895 RepID=UPI000D62FCF2|nr:putative MO25-like protein At5g47540 isoform X3 [Cynara cardunculus var. scolymus]